MSRYRIWLLFTLAIFKLAFFLVWAIPGPESSAKIMLYPLFTLELLFLLIILFSFKNGTCEPGGKHLYSGERGVLDALKKKEKEYREIVSKLHDDIAGNLLAVQYRTRDKNDVELHRIITRTFYDVKSISDRLYPPALQAGSLVDTIEEIYREYRPGMVFQPSEGIKEMSPAMVFTVLCMFQEILSAAEKYSDTDKVSAGLS